MSRYKIIVNPTADRGNGDAAGDQVDQILYRQGLEYDVVRTECPWHAAELAEEAALSGYDVVVSVGGDGTANEVLNGLMRAKKGGAAECAMGMIGVGTGNDFAFGVGVPPGVEAGCEVLLGDHRQVIDVGRVTGGQYPKGRYFGNGVGIGFDAAVGFEAAKMERLHGFLAYLVATLKTVFLYYQAPIIRMEFNDQTLIQPSLLVSIMNGRRMGGGFMMAPQGQPDDGLLHLCIAGQVSRPRIFALIPRFLKGTQASHPAIQTGRTQRIVATAVEGTLPAHADGETIATEGRQLDIELLPRQMQVICRPPEQLQ